MVIEQEGPLVFPFSLFFSHLRYFSTSKVGSRAWIVYFHGLLWTMYIVTSCVLCKKKNSRNRKKERMRSQSPVLPIPLYCGHPCL